MKVPEFFFFLSVRDSNDGKARAKDSCYSGSKGRQRRSSHLHVTVEKWASKEKQAAVSGVIEERADVKALISEAHFNLPSLVHNPGFCVCKCGVLLFLNHRDTMSY